MIPLIRRLVSAFLFDELAATRWIRGTMLMFAAGGVAFAESIAGLIQAPGAVRSIKIASLACGFIGGAVTAGEKNPKPGAK